MCGIAGMMLRNGKTPPHDALQAFARALVHRGPDGQGIYEAGTVGLVHTRLAIIDLQTGHQPLFASDRAALVANGEIYNDLELRERLGAAAYVTKSDCESALHLYVQDGENYAAGLRGMYAIAIHDRVRNQLVLSRDPFGIKPLYYAETDDGFFFASEPQALAVAGVCAPRVLDTARDELLALQFTTGSATIWRGVQRVVPGETLVVRNGTVVSRVRTPGVPAADLARTNSADPVKDFEAAWADSIHMHRRADVPYGMFLSGGIDSTAVLAMMARQEPRAVLAYTAAFPGTVAHDEREQARFVAQALGAAHIEVDVTEQDFWARLPEIAAAIDDPTADYAIVPTYLLAERAKADVRVILSGEGGDELFAGYGRYRAVLRPWPFRKQPWRKGVLQGLDLLRDQPNWRSGIDQTITRLHAAGFRGLQAHQALDMETWLPGDLLTKLDRCLMAHGIEGRVPFLDPVIANVAFCLPDDLKIRSGLGKWLIRQWLAQVLPGYPALARKRGFSVPVGEWIAAGAVRLAPLMAEHPAIAEICWPDRVKDLYLHGGPKLGTAQWLLLFYALWHNRHILGHKAEGDVFATLASART